MSDIQTQQLQMARSAAKSIQGHINDVQLFVLQPSNLVVKKAAALKIALRIERLALAVVKMCDAQASNDVAKPEHQEPETADNQVCDIDELLRMMGNIAAGRVAGLRRLDLDLLMDMSARMNEQLYNMLTLSGRDNAAQSNTDKDAEERLRHALKRAAQNTDKEAA